MKIDPFLSLYTKLKSKCIKDLNIKPTTLKLIEEKVGSSFEWIGTEDYFLNITPVAQTLREKKINEISLNWETSAKQEHDQQYKTAVYRMGKDFYYPHIRQKTDIQNRQRAQEIAHQKNK